MSFFHFPISKIFIKNLLITFLVVLIFVFYLWTVSTCYEAPFKFIFSKTSGRVDGGYHGINGIDHYNALSEAFLAGQLHLLTNEDIPESFLYQGKRYIYFGPAPAVTLFMPFRLIFKTCLPQDLSTALFGFGGFFFSVLLLLFLVKNFFSAAPFWMILISVLGLGLCTTVPFSLRTPEVYQVAVLAAYFYLFGGLYWLITGYLGKKVNYWKIALGSLFLGLAVGSRPHFVIWGVFLFYLLSLEFRKSPGSLPRRLKTFLILLGPFALCLLSLATYNFYRFHNILEFGTSYLSANHPDKIYWHTINWPYFFPNLFFFLFQSFRIELFFPFFILTYCAWLWPLPVGYMKTGVVAGIMFFSPFIWLIIISLLFYKYSFPEKRFLRTVILFFILMAVGKLIFLSLVSISAAMRYLVDFLPLLILASFLLWFYLSNKIRNRKFWHLFLNGFMVFSIFFACLFNVFISFYGSYNQLKGWRPDIYCQVASLFPRGKLKLIIAEQLDLKIILPEAKLNTLVNLLHKGEKDKLISIYFTRRSNDMYYFLLYSPENGLHISQPTIIRSGQINKVKIFWGSSSLLNPSKIAEINFCFLSVNGRELLSWHSKNGPFFQSPLKLNYFQDMNQNSPGSPGSLIDCRVSYKTD